MSCFFILGDQNEAIARRAHHSERSLLRSDRGAALQYHYNPLSISQRFFFDFLFFLFLFLVSDEVQCAWRFANDSYRLPLSLFTRSIYSTASIQYTAKTIAAACVYLAIRVLKKMPPENAVPTLLDMCGTDEAVLMRCCDCLKALYPNFDKQFLCRVCSKERKKERKRKRASKQVDKSTSKQANNKNYKH